MASIRVKFKMGKDIVITDKWVANGHWIVDKDLALTMREFKSAKGMALGDHRYGRVQPLTDELKTMVDKVANQVDLTKYKPLLSLNRGIFTEDGLLIAKAYRVGLTKVLLDPEYARLLDLGDTVLGCGPMDPVVVKNNGEIVALIMPRRS